MQNIRPRLGDSSPPQGRLAWIHRQQGKEQEAREEMAFVVRAYAWYLWGWGLLVDWLVEDQAWKQARELLGKIPEELRTNPQFRKQRLVVLEQAGLPVNELDAEWSGLLRISLMKFLSTFIVTICYERQSGFPRRTPF